VLKISAVIPGWSEGPDPESRDTRNLEIPGSMLAHRPGMTKSGMAALPCEPFDETRWGWLIFHAFEETSGAEE
jgi:hypothetical protein